MTRGDPFRMIARDRSRPKRPVVVRDDQPGRPPWLIVYTVDQVRRELRHRRHADAVVRAHEVAQMVADGNRGPFYSVDEILAGMAMAVGRRA